MMGFSISRLHSSVGIIKATGQWDADTISGTKFTQLEQMSTDGWVALDIHHPTNSQFIASIKAEVYRHLLSQQVIPASSLNISI
ncbi:hypothetical protein AB4140_15740 [Shewanella sp. 10N.286.51.B2]|uniref:hypothetical protein n=1 Tax=unclassified Shewanella TaxID=196818 RepID=UPI0026E31904|nr:MULTISPECIES: hypothetical protein [unclassified Shewanella]MDO6619533.1 hypothetical protein [Shewanella sp. 6_MG-2023]MDO6641237.1 hypothetical protein [Shewanella sp. 5_MG-2023]MDO6679449.1 hypothetical protein [Shewanella sp. 4_MG-2023]